MKRFFGLSNRLLEGPRVATIAQLNLGLFAQESRPRGYKTFFHAHLS